MTADEFHDWHARQDGNVELYKGRVVPRFGWSFDDGRWTMMAGGTVWHAHIAGNVYAALRRELAGQGCRVFNSEVAVRTEPDAIRYPEGSVLCDAEEIAALTRKAREIEKPKLIIEVLSPSTEKEDRGWKLMEYKALPSVRAIVLIEPGRRWMDVYVRVASSKWRNTVLLEGATLTLDDPAITLTAETIFED